jgi:hypothetical protein
VRDLGSEAVVGGQALLQALPAAFPVFNVCFALASAEDVDGLAALSVRLEADPRPAFKDLVAPIVRALIAVVQERHDHAVGILQSVLDDLPRVGGSNAQREVVEDTLISALVDAERLGEARFILEKRIGRRSHAIDSRLLDGATGMQA